MAAVVVRDAFKYVFAVVFIVAGLNHFLRPQLYLSIMPPYLPWHLFLVYLSGGLEIVLGAALLVPATRTLAAWGLVALLVAVFPANLYMAQNAAAYPGIPPLLLWFRLPLQAALVAWAYVYTRAP